MKSKIVLLFLLILAFWLRLYNLDRRAPFTDEKFTLLNANGFWVGAFNQTELTEKKYFTPADFWTDKGINDYFEAIAHSDFGTHIVYNAILHPWMKVFGNQDFTIRFPSIIFNLLTIVLVYFLVKRVFKSENPALFSSFFLAIEPLNIAQSHIARSYTLSFLLVVLATYLFICIIETHKPKKIYFVFYTLILALSLLNHYLNFLVPLAHGLTLIFLKKNLKIWISFIFAGIFNIILMLWWFNWGGGHTSLEFLKDKNHKHLIIAQSQSNSSASSIQISTPEIVAKKGLELFFDSSALSHGLFKDLNGVKNFFISICTFLLLLGIYYLFKRRLFKWSMFLLILFFSVLVYFNTIAFAILVSIFLYFIIYFTFVFVFYKDKLFISQKALAGVSLLMFFIPIVFVVFDALRNGHTTSLTHRYIGISSPFVAILGGIGIVKLFKEIKFAPLFLIIIIPFQYVSISKELKQFFDDNSIKYAWFEPARVQNPYLILAENVKKNYIEGDTLLIPSGFRDLYEITFGVKKSVSFNDAQYLNLYLPKNSKIIQRIEPSEMNKVFLVSRDGTRKLLFDFEGSKYRY